MNDEEMLVSLERTLEAAKEGQPIRGEVYIQHIEYLTKQLDEMVKAGKNLAEGTQALLKGLENGYDLKT